MFFMFFESVLKNVKSRETALFSTVFLWDFNPGSDILDFLLRSGMSQVS